MPNRGFIRGATAALIDQGWLSVVNLAIGLSFIRFAPKVDYAIYVQLFAALMLSTSVQNALVTTPLTTLGPKRSQSALSMLATHLLWFQTGLAIGLGGLVVVVLLMLREGFGLPGLDTPVIFAFAFAVITTWLREYLRHYEFLMLRTGRVLTIDLFFGAVLLLGIGIGLLNGGLSTATIFFCMGAANAAALLWGLVRSDLAVWRVGGKPLQSIADAWACGIWALPSVFVTWGYAQSYVYIVAAVVSVQATAELAAARLLMSPIVLISTSWGKVFLPRASAWLGAGEVDRVRRVALVSLAGLLAIVAGYVSVLLASYGWLERSILGEKYAGLELFLLLWGLYFVFNTIEIVGIQTLLSGEYFRRLFVYSCLSFAFGLPVIVLLTYGLATTGTLIGLSAAAASMACLAWTQGWPPLRREYSGNKLLQAGQA